MNKIIITLFCPLPKIFLPVFYINPQIPKINKYLGPALIQTQYITPDIHLSKLSYLSPNPIQLYKP